MPTFLFRISNDNVKGVGIRGGGVMPINLKKKDIVSVGAGAAMPNNLMKKYSRYRRRRQRRNARESIKNDLVSIGVGVGAPMPRKRQC